MLNQLDPEEILRTVPNLEQGAQKVASTIHEWVLDGGESRRQAADALHGTWLGHPFHPVLTDVTIGAWVFGTLLDLLGVVTRSKSLAKAGDTLVMIGNLSAIPTAVAGVTDFSTIPPDAAATAAAHGLLNAGGLVLNLMSSRYRASGRRGKGILFSLLTQGVLLVSAWLGGEMVYRYKTGVNRIPPAVRPKDWKPVMDDKELAEGQSRRVEVAGAPVLLYRYGGQVFAMGAVCGHEGGPLDEGKFDEYCVTCPWHQSVYDLRDGSVVHGPTTYVEPIYDTRTLGGKIEVRVREQPATAEAKQVIAQVVESARQR